MTQSIAISQSAEIVHAVQVGAGYVEPARLGAGGDQQPVVNKFSVTVGHHGPRGWFDRGDGDSGPQLDVVLLVEPFVMYATLLSRLFTAEVVLGQRRALIGELVLFTDQHDAAVEALIAELLRRFGTGQARADDHECLDLPAHLSLLFVSATNSCRVRGSSRMRP